MMKTGDIMKKFILVIIAVLIVGIINNKSEEVIIPKENFTESLLEIEDINIIPVENISEVFNCVFIEEEQNNFNSINILLADKEAK